MLPSCERTVLICHRRLKTTLDAKSLPRKQISLFCRTHMMLRNIIEYLLHDRYTNYRKRQEAEHAAWLKRKQERDEKIAKGEEVGPEEPDPTAEVEVGLLGLLKFIVYTLIIISLAGKFVTGSFMWDYEEYLPSLRQFLPVSNSSRSCIACRCL